MDIPVIYEDTDILVIAKPAGLIVHSDGRTEEPSLAGWVLKTYPETKDVGEPWTSPQGEIVPRPGIVHRLDRTTSGVMVVAKTAAAHAFLKEQFGVRSVKKEYRAFVYGHLKQDEGIIEAEIVRIRSKPPRWGVARKGEEKKHRAALTEWKLVVRSVDPDSGEKVSEVALFPKTGRTHQLRVHLKHIGFPIVCDHIYSAGKPCILGFERPALHAQKLSLKLLSGEERTFEAPFPEDFLAAESVLQIADE